MTTRDHDIKAISEMWRDLVKAKPDCTARLLADIAKLPRASEGKPIYDA